MRADWLLRCYPRTWRDRYEDEFRAMLEQIPVSLPVLFDLLRGALDAHLHPRLVASVSRWRAARRTVRRKPPGLVLYLLLLVLLFTVMGLPQFQERAAHRTALFA